MGSTNQCLLFGSVPHRISVETIILGKLRERHDKEASKAVPLLVVEATMRAKFIEPRGTHFKLADWKVAFAVLEANKA